MSLSDCVRCWETPCSCGWDYIDWSISQLVKQKELLDNIIELKEKYPARTKDLIYKKINEGREVI